MNRIDIQRKYELLTEIEVHAKMSSCAKNEYIEWLESELASHVPQAEERSDVASKNLLSDVDAKELNIKMNFINNDTYTGWPDLHIIVLTMVEHYHTKKKSYAILKRVNECDCEWRFVDDNSELDHSYNVIFWGYLPEI